jgi:small GTP-binding protein
LCSFVQTFGQTVQSSVLLRFAENTFTESFISTIGVDFKIRTVDIDGRVVKLQLWDTSGQERFRTITSSYYRGAHAILICFDLTDKQSFHNVRTWHAEIQRYACSSVNVLLVGCKTDLVSSRCVRKEDIEQLCAQLEVGYVECSAKNGDNCNQAFFRAAGLVYERMHSPGDAKQKKAPEVTFCAARNDESAAPAAAAAAAPGDESDGDDSAESFSEAELDESLVSAARKKSSAVPAPSSKAPGKKHLKHGKTDVNVFRLELNKVDDNVPLATGDPIMCDDCGAVLSSRSQITQMARAELLKTRADLRAKYCELIPAPPLHRKFAKSVPGAFEEVQKSGGGGAAVAPVKHRDDDDDDDDADSLQSAKSDGEAAREAVWLCDFCYMPQALPDDFDVEHERPEADEIEYIVAPALAAAGGGGGPVRVFAIDTSGSMCVTSEVPGKVTIKGAEEREREARELAAAEGWQYERMVGRHNVTHVSRLQCVQAAVAREIERDFREAPSTRVVLITFGDQVTVYGDGKAQPVVLAGAAMNDEKRLAKFAAEQALGGTVRDSKEQLLARLWALTESGATALGPALSVALAVARRGAVGSRVTLCTDGLANVGVGALDGGDEAARDAGKLTYIELGEQAKLSGVAVSLLSLIGAECKLEAISVVAEQSGGSIERINATDLLAESFGAIASKPVVAHGVMAMVVLHRGLQFKGEMDDEAENRNWLVKDLGTVTRDAQCAFRYAFRPREQIDLTGIASVPFQLQLLYTRRDGSVRMRLATARLETTVSRDDAEKDANLAVVATAVAQQAAKLARRGSFSKAQMETRAAQRFLARNGVVDDKIEAWSNQVASLDSAAYQQRQMLQTAPAVVEKASAGGGAVSGGGSGGGGFFSFLKKKKEKAPADGAAAPAPPAAEQQQQQRRLSFNDEQYSALSCVSKQKADDVFH